MAIINRDGDYSNSDSKQSNDTAVNVPGTNENLDESYRSDNDTSFRPEFSDLKNTYMVTTNGHTARERFWGKSYSLDHSYRNNNGDIEDPIFTGFTLSIDRKTSPLFYTIGQYDKVASGRTDEDGNSLSRNIADEIENSLQLSYSGRILQSLNSYELIAALTKDKFPNEKEIGYGMQHNVYLDGIPYGAVEYIYMVDKYVENNNVMQDTKGGQYSLGNGEKTTAAVDLNNLQSSVYNVNRSIETYSGAVKEAEKEKTSDAINEHNAIKAVIAKGEDEYNENVKEIAQHNANIESYQNNSKEAKEIEYETAVRNKLQNKVTNMSNLFKELLPDSENAKLKRDEYDEIVEKIVALAPEIENIINTYHGKPDKVKTLITPNDNVDVKSCTISLNYTNEREKYKALKVKGIGTYDASNAYDRGYKYSSMSFIKVRVDVEVSDPEALIASEKSEIEKLEKRNEEISKANAENTQKLNNDAYTQADVKQEEALQKLESAKIQRDNIANSQKAKELGIEPAADGTLNFTGATTPTTKITGNSNGDTESTQEDDFTRQNSNKKKLADAPQTVYDMLGFISGMRRLTEEYPYMLQSITGLDEAYKNNYVVKDSFRGSGDNKISISIYESLDLKVSGMFNKYFNAVYDAQYRRERVPVNLRRFNCSVFVHDIRNFFKMPTSLGDKLRNASTSNISKIVEIALNSLSAIEFKFYGCEIVPEETGSIFDTVGNAERGEMRMTNFVFTYSDVVVNYLPFEDLKINVLNNIRHVPSVSVNKGTDTSLDKLKFKGGSQLYEYTNTQFDSKRPTLTTKFSEESNQVRKSNKSEYNNDDFDYNEGELAGLESKSKNTTPQAETKSTNIYGTNYTVLHSPLGNVNDNDAAVESQYDTINNERQLTGIVSDGTLDKNGHLASLGNVDINDNLENKYEDTYDWKEKYKDANNLDGISINGELDNHNHLKTLGKIDLDYTFKSVKDAQAEHEVYYKNLKNNVIKKGYNDRTEYGNVNTDDYEESMYRRYNKSTYDRINELKAEEMVSNAEINANASVNENIEESINNINSIFHQLSTSLSASTGIDMNVYENYFQEMRNIVYPGLDTETVGQIRYNSSVDSRNTVVELDTPEVAGISAISRDGVVSKLGDVDDNDSFETKPEDNFVSPTIQGLSTQVSDGKITSLGDVMDDDNNGNGIRYIDDVIPDDDVVPNVGNIGNVYPNEYTPVTKKYIDDVIPDDAVNPSINSIGNVYPTSTSTGTQGYIDDVIPDEAVKKAITNLSNIYTQLKNKKNVTYIDDVIPDDNANDVLKKLDLLYEKISQSPIIDDLGKVK